ncbi:MAG: DNA polymerase III subunit delta [Muribaculaceae bacterium]|nr:DNA polymerase III subunit delta [Muribaculaceae bacterium]
MRFSDIPGHKEIKAQLRQLVDSGRIPHALLLEGPEGIGKHALARAFIQYVTCSNRRNGDSCGVCPACVQHAALQHIDTIYTFPYVKPASSKTYVCDDYLRDFIDFVNDSPYMDTTKWAIKLGNPNTKPVIYVDEATELIRKLSYAPHSSRYKSVIIWQADKLNDTAANKLLKLIEEPPGQAIIVMTSSEPMNILPTVYSRVQRIKVPRHADEEVANFIMTTTDTDVNMAVSLAPLARGSFLQAIQLVEKRNDTERYLEKFISLMRLAYQRDIHALKEWANETGGEKRDYIVGYLEYMARMLRENFISNLHDASFTLMMPAESNFSKNFARFVNERNVIGLYEAVSQAIVDIRGNANTRIVLFDLAITVILLLKQ